MIEQKYVMEGIKDVIPPEQPLFRDDEVNEIVETLAPLLDGRNAENIHVYGEKGSGKTYLLSSVSSKLLSEDQDLSVVKVDCRIHDTEYKFLRKIGNFLGGDIPESGYSLTLARDIFKKAVSESGGVILILENIEMLLNRDGDKMFYFVSRLKNKSDISLVTTSSEIKKLNNELSSRTRSSYSCNTIELRNLKTEEAFEILNSYFKNFGLGKYVIAKSIALSRYESSGEFVNLKIALNTLRELVGRYEKPFDEKTIESAYLSVQRKRYNFLKEMLSNHEKLLLKAVRRVSWRDKKTWSGSTYEAYRELCQENNIKPHSERILGDYLIGCLYSVSLTWRGTKVGLKVKQGG